MCGDANFIEVGAQFTPVDYVESDSLLGRL